MHEGTGGTGGQAQAAAWHGSNSSNTELEKMFRQNSKYTLARGAYFWQNKFVSDVGAPLEMF